MIGYCCLFILADAQFKEEDIAHSLLYSITEQLAHTAYLTAKAEGIDKAIFCGSFISANAAIIEQINSKLAHCELYLKVSEWHLFAAKYVKLESGPFPILHRIKASAC